MNTISNSQSTIDVYALRRIQEAKAIEQSRLQQHQKQQEESDSISISQQALQTTQVASQNVSPLDSLVTCRNNNSRSSKCCSKCISI